MSLEKEIQEYLNSFYGTKTIRPDYTTNSKSYYDYLEKVTAVLIFMSKKIDDYDGILTSELQNIKNTLDDYLEKWDENLENFDDSVLILLQEWMDDGTFEHIINHEIFKNKLDTSIFEQFELSVNQQLQQNEDKLRVTVDTTENVQLIKIKNPTLTDTEIFRKAVSDAIARSPIEYGWREPVVIDIPSGHYNIDGTIIDESMDIRGGKFVFRGAGSQSTIINFKPETEMFLIDSKAMIGNTTFDGIRFESNHKGKFLNAQGGAPGMAQSFIFDRCYWLYFKEIIRVTGDTMGSEVTFNDCKIKEGASDCIWFHLENSQAVNWRFYGTDIESFAGVLFNYMQGMSISFYQGSIIALSGGTIVKVPTEANANMFGQGNAPHFQMDGVRFEIRGLSKLVHIENGNVRFRLSFRNVNMGGFNVSDLATHFPIDIKGKGYFQFDNCENWGNIKARHEVLGTSDYLQPAIVEFRSLAPGKSFIEKSVVTYATGSSNTGAAPIYNYVNCFLDTAIRLRGHNKYNDYFTFPIKKHFHSKRQIESQLFQADGKEPKIYTIDLPQIELVGAELKLEQTSGYGAFTYHIQVKDEVTNQVILDSDVDMQQKTVVKVADNFISNRFDQNGKLTVTLTPVTDHASSTIPILGNLILEY